jgi:hypothetical protein
VIKIKEINNLSVNGLSGPNWLIVIQSGGLFLTWQQNFEFHEMWVVRDGLSGNNFTECMFYNLVCFFIIT